MYVERNISCISYRPIATMVFHSVLGLQLVPGVFMLYYNAYLQCLLLPECLSLLGLQLVSGDVMCDSHPVKLLQCSGE